MIHRKQDVSTSPRRPGGGGSVFFGLVDVQTDDLQLRQVVAAAAALLTDHHLRETHTRYRGNSPGATAGTVFPLPGAAGPQRRGSEQQQEAER